MKTKSFLLLCLFVGITIAQLSAQGTKVNFSGKWIINIEKSQLLPTTFVKEYTIEQYDNVITFKFTHLGLYDKETTSSYSYTVDGSKSTKEDDFGVEVTIAKWSEDGKSFTVSRSINSKFDPAFNEELLDEYKISKDLKTLTISHTTDFATYQIIVYDKAVN